MADLVFWICLFVGCTAVPMTVDLLRTFFPASTGRSGRLVAQWQRPVLLVMVACLCVWAYLAFWFSILPYTTTPFTGPWWVHVTLVTMLWVNTVWNYCCCAATDPGYINVTPSSDPTKDVEASKTADFAHNEGNLHPLEFNLNQIKRCAICERRVLHFDHHCPFTGGCVGAYNYRFFALFLAHCTGGCMYASFLSWRPFVECVLRQCNVAWLGMVRTQPPSVQACISMGSRSLLLLPALMLSMSLVLLGVFHFLLLLNGLTTVQYVRRWRSRGMRSVHDLLFLHGEPETDKWRLLWGRPVATASLLWRLRIFLLPSLPERRRLGPGVGHRRAWIGAGATILVCILLLPCVVVVLEIVGQGLNRFELVLSQDQAVRHHRATVY